MRKTLITLLNVYFFINSFSQDYHKVDSLRQLLHTTHDDTIKGLTIFGIAREYMWTKPDTCLYYTNLGLDLVADPSIKNKFESSENPFLYSFEIRMYSISSTALSEQRNDALAIRMGLKSLQLAEKSKDKYDIPRVYWRLSEVYQNIGEPAIAIEYFRKELLLDTSGESRTGVIASIGTCFYDLGEYDSALYYLNKIDPFFKLDGNKYWPVPPHYLGKIYTKKGNYKKALLCYRTAISYAEQAHLTKDLGEAYFGISEVFKNLGLTDSALLCARQSLKIANELSLPGQSLDASIFLSSLYESKGLIDSAFKYQKVSIALKDSLFNKEKIKQGQNYTFNEKLRQQEMKEEHTAYQNKIRIYALAAGLFVLLLMAAILLRNNRHKQKLNSILQTQKEEIQITLADLKSTQSQLIQSEKMASLGELTAGIAHEIQNPLNFVNNFSEVNKELIEEIKSHLASGETKLKSEEIDELLNDIAANEEKINHHGKRADAIVKGMLQHSRSSSGVKEPTNINALANEYLRLAYHGLRAKDKLVNATMKTDFDGTIGNINIIPQDIGRAILNLITNAFYAASLPPPAGGGFKEPNYKHEPTVWVSTKKVGDKILISVRDNGPGIPQKVLDKIFQPFFTTKPTGQGTGLGLSLAYDIVKAHGGEIKVQTKENEESEFIIQLPVV